MTNTIRIDTANIGVSWALGETYRVQMDEGFVFQDGGMNLPIAGGNITTFSTPAYPPQIISTSPNNNGTASVGFQTISATFDRASLTVLGGNIYLYRLGSPNVLVKTQQITSVNTSGNVVSMNIVGNIIANQTYFLTANANIVMDRDGFKNNAITNSSTFKFTAPTDPQVVSYTPSNFLVAADKGFQTITMTYDRNITANIGNVYLYTYPAGQLVANLSIGSRVTATSADTLSANIVGLINADAQYYTRHSANIVYDATLINSFATGNVVYFLAPSAPTVASVFPSNASVISDPNVTITFDRTVSAYQGNLYLYDNTNTLINRYNILNNVTINNTQLNFNVYGLLQGNTTYYITSNANIVQDNTLIRSNLPGNVVTFTTPGTITLSSTSPANGNVAVMENQTANLTISRLASISGSIAGNIYLYKTQGPTLVKNYSSSNLTIAGSNINFDISGQLDPSTDYYVTADANLIHDNLGISFAGISSNTAFAFTTSSSFNRDWPNTFILGTNQLITGTSYSANTYSLTVRTSNSISNISTTASGGTFSWNVLNPYTQTAEGKDGGGGQNSTTGYGGGGGGADYVYGNPSGSNGGTGYTSSITGASYTYAGGGGGGAKSGSAGTGGNGGGGAGSLSAGGDATYYGGGGGGAGSQNYVGGWGYQGIVILRYIADQTNASATGGSISTSGEYTIHTFTANANFVLTADSVTTVEYLIVAGGGGGGTSGALYSGLSASGGGGAGGVRYGVMELTSNTYSVVVGNRGIRGDCGHYGNDGVYTNGVPGGNGGDSSFNGITAHGGGGGGGGGYQAGSSGYGKSGGSGGGAAGGPSYHNYGGGTPGGDFYTQPVGNLTITGNLTTINKYLGSLSVSTISGVTTPYNLKYRLINGNNEASYKTINLTGATSYYRTTANVGGGGGGGGNTYVSTTQLLLHFEGADNSSTFTDSSQNAFTFTRINSTVYISTSDYKFGSASYYDSATSGNGNGIYINGSRPSALQCQGNFTIEFFAKLNSSGAVQTAFGLGQALFNLTFIQGSNKLIVEKSTGGTYGSGFKETDFTLPSGCYDNWHHYAFVRNGNSGAFYVDGAACSVSSGNASTLFSDGSPSTGASHDGGIAVCIGDMWYNSDYGFRGSRMDEFRFSNIAVYTSGFTPPSSAFTG
jgi:hypothetical protein